MPDTIERYKCIVKQVLTFVYHYFVLVQVDNEYRIAWDQFVLKLDVVDSDPLSGSEVLHWVTKFPVSTVLKSTLRHELLLFGTVYIWCVLLYLHEDIYFVLVFQIFISLYLNS